LMGKKKVSTFRVTDMRWNWKEHTSRADKWARRSTLLSRMIRWARGPLEALHRNNIPVMFRSIYCATLSLPSFQAWTYDSAPEHDVGETFRRHEAYCFHSTAVIDHGC